MIQLVVTQVLYCRSSEREDGSVSTVQGHQLTSCRKAPSSIYRGNCICLQCSALSFYLDRHFNPDSPTNAEATTIASWSVVLQIPACMSSACATNRHPNHTTIEDLQAQRM